MLERCDFLFVFFNLIYSLKGGTSTFHNKATEKFSFLFDVGSEVSQFITAQFHV